MDLPFASWLASSSKSRQIFASRARNQQRGATDIRGRSPWTRFAGTLAVPGWPGHRLRRRRGPLDPSPISGQPPMFSVPSRFPASERTGAPWPDGSSAREYLTVLRLNAGKMIGRSEVRGRKSEVRGQKSEVRGQRSSAGERVPARTSVCLGGAETDNGARSVGLVPKSGKSWSRSQSHSVLSPYLRFAPRAAARHARFASPGGPGLARLCRARKPRAA